MAEIPENYDPLKNCLKSLNKSRLTGVFLAIIFFILGIGAGISLAKNSV